MIMEPSSVVTIVVKEFMTTLTISFPENDQSSDNGIIACMLFETGLDSKSISQAVDTDISFVDEESSEYKFNK